MLSYGIAPPSLIILNVVLGLVHISLIAEATMPRCQLSTWNYRLMNCFETEVPSFSLSQRVGGWIRSELLTPAASDYSQELHSSQVIFIDSI